ncbi:uncharacterized protein B0H18DRAFT_1123101 [Fomitopsis serialis]|uniref:uncharacterized protein n=1 Tax=Fomitopsis serialis TaxID=139415 RepID=UPI002007780D|nr:uncharacterized protein B0H18DRAFT_1123101 [Neoantrodia serialis]KAH9918318.1 hypothetical protein B0H18DRAFT_1123101 [Neoantrodia serialis]
MRYSPLASAALLAVVTAPALAHPVSIRATEDPSIVERELQDGLVERGYYDDLVSRDLEARKNSDRGAKHLAGMIKKDATKQRQRQGQSTATSSGSARQSGSGPASSHPQQNRQREYDVNGELFTRTPEDASVVERELRDGLVERGFYEALLSRGLEARTNAEHGAKQQILQGPPGPARTQARRIIRNRQRNKAQAASGRQPHPQANGGSGVKRPHLEAGAHHRRREYENGELFERGFEIDELD